MIRALHIVLLAACGLLAGCGAAVSSSRVGSLNSADYKAGRARGEVYYMPRAVLLARLMVSPTLGLHVTVEQPDFIADTGAQLVEAVPGARPCTQPGGAPAVTGPFALSYRISGFHKDTVTIETERSLLKSVIADTEENTTEALSNLAKSVARLKAEAGADGDFEEILSVRFDPADCNEVASVVALIRNTIDDRGVKRLGDIKTAAGANGPLAALDLDAAPKSDFTMSLAGWKPFRLPEGARTSAADCRKGVCVPVQVPASIVINLGGRRSETTVLYLPNRSDPVAVPVSRSGFADVKTTLTLDHGILTKREIVRTSEVAAILLLPATLVGAYLDEISAAFTGKKAAFDSKAAYLKAVEEAKAKPEAGDLPANARLLDIPAPGLSVGTSKPSVTPVVVNPPVNSGRESPQGNGDGANQQPNPGS